MELDRDSCSRAVEARDARFDGVFFVAITTTRIYCRPICPARATKRENRRFYSTQAAAELAGFRPCLRCRPELAPGRARIDAVTRLAESAARRISAGALNGRGVDDLARDLGVGARQLRRALHQELGVSPVDLAQTSRLLFAKQLLTSTQLSITQVAFASGFESVRRFNALFLDRYRLNPRTMRRNGSAAANRERDAAGVLRLALSYRPPIAWDALLGFLGARAARGVEHVSDGVYSRIVRMDGHTGTMRVSRPAESTAANGATPHSVLYVDVDASLAPVLMPLCARIKQLFDLDAEPDRIESHLLAAGLPGMRDRPRGVRVPGAFDGFELAVRAVLGQQVTVKGATTLMTRLTVAFGEAVETADPALTHLPPTADRIAHATVTQVRAIGIPEARAATLVALAKAIASGDAQIEADADVEELKRRLTALPGIGPWTAEYIAMRAAHWPDAFPHSDIALRHAAGDLTAAALARAAEAWRPWRAYAAMHLWMSNGHLARAR